MCGNKAILKFILAVLLVCFATAKEDFDENLLQNIVIWRVVYWNCSLNSAT